MGYGGYSVQDRTVRAASAGYATKSVQENFEQRSIHTQMSPLNVLRESRDSEEHPNSLPLIVGLDVTGSMGMVPQMFIVDGLPTMMTKVFKAGIKDLNLLIMAIGDDKCDRSPLQVGQFEASDELIDKWLQLIHVESGGGGNGGESYPLAWLFAGYQTDIDSFKKRGQKGFLFTIGDENYHSSVNPSKVCGLGDAPKDSKELLKKAQETYHVYHLHLSETGSGWSTSIQDKWKALLGENCIIVDDYKDIPSIIANTMASVLQSYVEPKSESKVSSSASFVSSAEDAPIQKPILL